MGGSYDEQQLRLRERIQALENSNKDLSSKLERLDKANKRLIRENADLREGIRPARFGSSERGADGAPTGAGESPMGVPRSSRKSSGTALLGSGSLSTGVQIQGIGQILQTLVQRMDRMEERMRRPPPPQPYLHRPPCEEVKGMEGKGNRRKKKRREKGSPAERLEELVKKTPTPGELANLAETHPEKDSGVTGFEVQVGITPNLLTNTQTAVESMDNYFEKREKKGEKSGRKPSGPHRNPSSKNQTPSTCQGREEGG